MVENKSKTDSRWCFLEHTNHKLSTRIDVNQWRFREGRNGCEQALFQGMRNAKILTEGRSRRLDQFRVSPNSPAKLRLSWFWLFRDSGSTALGTWHRGGPVDKQNLPGGFGKFEKLAASERQVRMTTLKFETQKDGAPCQLRSYHQFHVIRTLSALEARTFF